jgi:hypothetical protein
LLLELECSRAEDVITEGTMLMPLELFFPAEKTLSMMG